MKKDITCPECGSHPLVKSNDKKELICTTCGLVMKIKEST